MTGWRVWYDNGEVYDSKSHQWADLPADGLMVKMIYYMDGTKQIQQGMDWYGVAEHPEGEIHFTTQDHPTKVAVEGRYKNAILKQGRWAPDDFYRKVCDMAHASKWDD